MNLCRINRYARPLAVKRCWLAALRASLPRTRPCPRTRGETERCRWHQTPPPSLHALDRHSIGVRGQRFEVLNVAGKDCAAGLRQRDQHRASVQAAAKVMPGKSMGLDTASGLWGPDLLDRISPTPPSSPTLRWSLRMRPASAQIGPGPGGRPRNTRPIRSRWRWDTMACWVTACTSRQQRAMPGPS